MTTAETLVGTDLDAVTVWERLQVDTRKGRPLRQYVGVYEVIDDGDVAFGVTRRNRGHGPGGYPQVYVPNPESRVRLVDKIKLN